MCPCSYVYTVEELQRMTRTQMGEAIWEYENDQVVDEMVEAYGGIQETAEAVVDCFADGDAETDTAQYIIGLGRYEMVASVVAYLETLT